MNIVAEMLLSEPAPAAVWGVLMLLALPALMLLASPHGVTHPGPTLVHLAGSVRRLREERRARLQEARETVRYAEEVRAAARRAGHGAQLWQEHWRESELRVAGSWQAWQEAQARVERLRTAAAFGTPWTVPSPAEYAGRERWLHLAVRAAAGRGELPATAVGDAVAGRGWDARLHPCDQELVLARASATYLWEQYDRAAAAEQTAWHDAQLARRTADDLRREAAAATVRASAVGHLVPAGAPAGAPAAAPAPAPHAPATAVQVRTA